MRPYVVLSCAVSVDGYLDDRSARRLILSNPEDLDRVDAVRADSDAILVGAETVRRDDPRLVVRSADRRAARVAAGRTPDPMKVMVTGSGHVAPNARFFTTGDGPRVVYCPAAVRPGLAAALDPLATVVTPDLRLGRQPGCAGRAGDRDGRAGDGERVELSALLADLHARGVGRLMVEGGAGVLSALLGAGLADEIHLAVAPFFVGDPAAPRFAGPGDVPWTPGHPMRLREARKMGAMVLLRYDLPPRPR